MSEKTTVKFTQLGREISFSAGYIVAVTQIDTYAFTRDYSNIYFGTGLITQLGVVPVDGNLEGAMLNWHAALAAPSDPPSTIAKTPLGNDAEF